jgi:hypothetical protein
MFGLRRSRINQAQVKWPDELQLLELEALEEKLNPEFVANDETCFCVL